MATKTTISQTNISALKSAGCEPSVSTNNANEVIKLSNRHITAMPNRQVILFQAPAEACTTQIGKTANINFPSGFYSPEQYSKLKFNMKAEIAKFDAGNNKEAISYITGYESEFDFEVAYTQFGSYSKFLEDLILGKKMGGASNVVSLLVYGVTNPVIDKDWHISGDGIKALLIEGPLESSVFLVTGDEKAISTASIKQHGRSRRITLPNTNGQFNNLINAMFGVDDIMEDLWDNENPQKLLK